MENESRQVGPVTKATSNAGTASGAAALLTVYIVYLITGHQVPPGVEGALALVIAFIGGRIGGWLVRPGTGTRRG